MITTSATTPTETIVQAPTRTKTESHENIILMIQEPPQTRFIELVMPQRSPLHCQKQQNLQTIVQVPANQSKEAKVFVLTRQQMLKLMSKHTKPKSKITSAPFLSRPPPSTPMVIEREPHTIVDQSEKVDPSVKERHSRYSSPISIQYQLQDTITTTTSIENNLNWNCSEQPLILTSMADTELSETNIMTSHSIVEESGAMPPTVATVEELNVPVFINECIQELSDGPAKRIQHARNYNINSLNNHNSNNDNTTNNVNVDNSGNTCELLDIFDFDLEHLSEDQIDALVKEQLEEDVNLKITNDDECNGHYQQQQLFLNQLMDVFILDGNNSNNFNLNTEEVVITNNNNNNNNNSNNNYIHNHTTLNDDKLLINNNNKKIMNSSLGHNSQIDDDELFKCLPDSQYDEITIDEIPLSQNALEINELFENCCVQYQSSATAELSRTVSMAKPLITAENDNEATTTSIINNNCYMTMIKEEEEVFPSFSTDYNKNKRPNKLLLNINEPIIKSEHALATPIIVESILNNSEVANFNPQSVDTIRKQLEENISPEYCENSTEFCSDVSTTNQSYATDYPTSPWSSSTITDSKAQQKRGRGRPAKNHCDIPDLTQFRHLSEGEKKKIMERYKNNEASRKSRLKNKEQEQRLIREEEELQKTVNEKKNILLLHRKMQYKLTRALRRSHFSVENMMKS